MKTQATSTSSLGVTTLRYRPEIDGLRALAVVSVVLLHAGVARASGGYVGVDVFFVISGFLISRILFGELDRGEFSLLRFYDRRVRRIVPAFAFMVVVTTLVGLFVLTPLALERFGQSLIPASLFSSNLWFWRGTNYFAQQSHREVLLHTWSLGVEEQFYILWPLVLWVLTRPLLRRFFLPLCVAASLVSLLVSEYAAHRAPAAAFYLLPSRGWELLLGAVLASPTAVERRRLAAKINESLAALGVALIILCVFTYGAETTFPGLHAAVPCVGAALILHFGEGTGVARILAARPIAFVGLISYSLYLLHWPSLALMRYYTGDRALTAGESALALLIAAILSVVSWRFVERPFRRTGAGRVRVAPATSIGSGFTVLSGLAGLGGVLLVTDGFPSRAPQAVLEVETALRLPDGAAAYCPKSHMGSEELVICQAGSGSPKVALWGDSHAGELARALAALPRESQPSVLFIINAGCLPGIGANRVSPRLPTHCRENAENAMAELRRHNDISTVVLASRWSVYVEALRAKGEDGVQIYLTDDVSAELSRSNSRRIARQSLDRTLTQLEDRKVQVILVGQVPEFGFDVGPCVAHARWRGLPESICFVPASGVQALFATTHGILRDLVHLHSNVRYIDPLPFFCDDTMCRNVQSGEVLFSDDNHLSFAGGKYLLSRIGIDWNGGDPSVDDHVLDLPSSSIRP